MKKYYLLKKNIFEHYEIVELKKMDSIFFMAISLTVSALTTYISHFKFTYKHNILQNKPHKEDSHFKKNYNVS